MTSAKSQRLRDAGPWREFFQGARDALPIITAASPFGALFGAAAMAAGLTPGEAIAASALLYAGASQFVFLEVNGLGVPVWSVLLAVFAVNFRHLLYSASLAHKLDAFGFWQKVLAFFFLTDPQWASAEARFDRCGLRPAYYFGYAVLLYSLWLIGTLVGIFFGSLIEDPNRLGFDMLLPVYFLVLLMGFRGRPRWLPVVVVSGVTSALLTVTIGPPWHISLGALSGILVAAAMPVAGAPAPPEALIDVPEESDHE